MRKNITLTLIGTLFISTGCARHESFNSSFKKQGNEFVGTKPTDPPGLLQEAISNNDVEKVRELIATNIDINMILPNKRTPLIHATREAKYRLMSMLLQAKAEPNSKDSEGMTALDWAIRNAGVDGNGKPLVNRAVILLSPEAQLAQRKELMKFSGRGSGESVRRLLVEVGVDPNFIDDAGDTPLTIAIRRKKPLSVNALANWTDCDGGEASSGCLRLTATDVNLAGADGVRPMSLAKQSDNPEIIDLLTKAGAKE